jgi:hypothetical protein
MADDAKARKSHSQEELRLAEEALRAEYDRQLGMWQFGFGKLRIRAAVHSQFITFTYVLFNLLCFVAGIVFIPFGGALQSLGVALIVGGLFSFGAFVSQFWAIQVEREREVFDRAFDVTYKDIRYKEFQRLGKRVWELSEEIERPGNLRIRHCRAMRQTAAGHRYWLPRRYNRRGG